MFNEYCHGLIQASLDLAVNRGRNGSALWNPRVCRFGCADNLREMAHIVEPIAFGVPLHARKYDFRDLMEGWPAHIPQLAMAGLGACGRTGNTALFDIPRQNEPYSAHVPTCERLRAGSASGKEPAKLPAMPLGALGLSAELVVPSGLLVLVE